MKVLRDLVAPWGDLASVVGLVLSVVGFLLTIAVVLRSKTAAEQARQAAKEARDSIASYNVVADLSAAMALMEEIKRHHRNRTWAALPERYSELRKRLAAIRASRLQIGNAPRQTLQATIETFKRLERKVETAQLGGREPTTNPAKFNDIVSGHIDEVHAVLLVLQNGLRSDL